MSRPSRPHELKALDQIALAPARPQTRPQLLGKYIITQASGQKINAPVPLEILDLFSPLCD